MKIEIIKTTHHDRLNVDSVKKLLLHEWCYIINDVAALKFIRWCGENIWECLRCEYTLKHRFEDWIQHLEETKTEFDFSSNGD